MNRRIVPVALAAAAPFASAPSATPETPRHPASARGRHSGDKRRKLGLSPLAVVALAAALIALSPIAHSGGGSSPEAQWLLSQINAGRRAAGVAAVMADPAIAAVAEAHARDMLARGYFAHISPDGGTLAGRLSGAGVRFAVAGENLAGHWTVTGAHQLLLSSVGHRAVMLDPSYSRAGIAVIKGGPWGFIIVEVFIRPADEASPAAAGDAGTGEVAVSRR